MHSKAVLKAYERVHVLSKSTTSIGKIGCDIIIEDCTAEDKHAVLEYCNSENGYILHDLNTVHGTYVNDCRIQNAAVHLAHGDIIRFGFNSKPFEFLIENYQDQNLNIQQKWHSPVQILVSTPRIKDCQESSLPVINSANPVSSPNMVLQRPSCVQPHPPLRSRPMSAGSAQHPMSKPLSCSALKTTAKEAWTSENVADRVLQEKDQKLLRMGDEINRLAIFEQESKRKDATIAQLRDENSQLQDQLMLNQANTTAQICQKLKSIDQEINSKRSDINSLHRQVDTIECKFSEGNTLTTQLADREKKIHELRHDLDKFKRDYGMSQGLVSSLQCELQSKEATLTKKKDEIASLKAKLTQKDVQLSSISAKFARITEDKSKDDLIDSIKKECRELKLKLQASDSRANDQVTLLQSYKQEISKLQSSIKTEMEEKKKLKQELESFQLKFNDTQRSERVLRVDLEQSKSRLDRFRMRVIRTVYACPGIDAPNDDDKIDDSSIVADIKKISEQRSEFQDQKQRWKNEVNKHETKLEDIKNANDTCKQVLEDIIGRLDRNGHHTRLVKHEKQILTSLPIDESLVWIRSVFTDLLTSELNWLSQLDECLADAGIDVFLSNQNPAEHVSTLYKALKDEEEAHHQTTANISHLELKHKEELENRIAQLLQENEEKLASEIEKMRNDEQQKFNDDIEAMRVKEEEKRLQALFNEREKATIANLDMEKLQKALHEKSDEEMRHQQQIHEALQKIKDLEDIEKQLRAQLSDLENQNKLESLVLNDQLTSAKQDISREVEQYKEEILQHSITIVTLEKQTQTLATEKKHLESTIKNLKENLLAKESELRRPPSPPSKSSLSQTADVSAMEQTIALLKSQLLNANHQIHMQQDTVIGLQKDLSGAQARISDMTGELSESQKQEMEHNRQTIKHQDIELNTLRQKLLKMTALVDSLKSQMKNVQKELLECKENNVKQKDCAANDLKSQHNEAQTDKTYQETQTDFKQQEGKIATELSGIGAICRGERHENVIARQREALAELRARIKALEQIRPPLPSQEQALQQVILLKKELAEIRAKQAMEEDRIAHAQMKMEYESQDSQQLIRSAKTQASIERTTREHLEEGVAQSEKSYMDIMNSVAGLLGISALKGMRSMQHVPQDELDKLSNDRRADLEIISTRVRSMLQRLDRKEHLLQGYEKDLSKLREAESFASKKSSQLAMLTQELMDKSQEIDHLREALTRTRETVEVEKRLNKAIKQRRTFHLENLDYRQPLPEGCSCYQSDLDSHKADSKSKKKFDKMKRKQYEIDVLKQSVQGKEHDLCQATAQLVGLRSSNTDELSEIYNMQQKTGSQHAETST